MHLDVPATAEVGRSVGLGRGSSVVVEHSGKLSFEYLIEEIEAEEAAQE